MDKLDHLDFIAKHGKHVPDELYHKILDERINDDFHAVRASAFSHPKITEKHIKKGLNDYAENVRFMAARHDNATEEQLRNVCNNTNETASVRLAATNNLIKRK